MNRSRSDFWTAHYEDRGEFEHDLLVEGIVADDYELITDPRAAYLTGIAEGMQLGYQVGINRFLSALLEEESQPLKE
jgi:hypothetical protein